MSFEAIYASEWQAVWALWVAPLVFLLIRGSRGPLESRAHPELARWLDLYCVVFAVQTLIDPFATTTAVRLLELSETVATALGVLFVWLGDFRVLVLVFAVAAHPRWLRGLAPAAGLAALVPALAYAVYANAAPTGGAGLDARWLYLTHEVFFVVLALALRGVWLPERVALEPRRVRLLSEALLYCAGYYALWAISDVLILAEVDAGYALRIVANQLYYAFWVPFVWWRARVALAP